MRRVRTAQRRILRAHRGVERAIGLVHVDPADVRAGRLARAALPRLGGIALVLDGDEADGSVASLEDLLVKERGEPLHLHAAEVGAGPGEAAGPGDVDRRACRLRELDHAGERRPGGRSFRRRRIDSGLVRDEDAHVTRLDADDRVAQARAGGIDALRRDHLRVVERLVELDAEALEAVGDELPFVVHPRCAGVGGVLLARRRIGQTTGWLARTVVRRGRTGGDQQEEGSGRAHGDGRAAMDVPAGSARKVAAPGASRWVGPPR